MLRPIVAILVVLIIIVIFYNYTYKYSHKNVINISTCDLGINDGSCDRFKVHKLHDYKEAIGLMTEINHRNKKFIEYLQNKYVTEFKGGIDPSKGGRIDIIPGSELYTQFAGNLDNQNTLDYLQERIEQLLKNYNSDRVYEISPLNKSGVTSYAQDKKDLILCLRRKTPDQNGDNPLHDINTMMFVDIHELSHMSNNLWGHNKDFWELFKFMLKNAVECGVYQPVDYSQHPIVYCGLELTYNPLYDTTLPS